MKSTYAFNGREIERTYRLNKKDVRQNTAMHSIYIRPFFTFDPSAAIKILTDHRMQLTADYEENLLKINKGVGLLLDQERNQ